MKTKFFYVAALIFLFNLSHIFAQAGGLNIMLGFPMGEFRDNVDHLGFGLSSYFLFLALTNNRPLGIGLNI